MDRSSFALKALRSQVRPFRLHWFPRLRSTNDHAAAMRKRGDLFAPAIVVTGHQTAGRGRGNHVWWSGAGCITVTFVLPIDDQVEPHQVPLLAGLAVRNAAAGLTGNDAVQLKWPNDVLYDFRKLGGLLCERIMNADLVGLGLNVNLAASKVPRALRSRVTSLARIAGRPIDLTQALSVVAAHMRRMLLQRGAVPFSAVLREYDGHHALLGRKVSIIGSGAGDVPLTGRCEGLDAMGRLLVRSRSTLHHVISGQVVFQ